MGADHKIRCGDIVRHGLTDEEWLVAWADYESGDLAWCGWPNGIARLSDCTLVKAATDEQHRARVAAVAKCGDSRAHKVRHLYASALEGHGND